MKKMAIITNGFEGASVNFDLDISETPIGVIRKILTDNDLAQIITNDPKTRDQYIDGTFDKTKSQFAVVRPSGDLTSLDWEKPISSQLPKDLVDKDKLEIVLTIAAIVG